MLKTTITIKPQLTFGGNTVSAAAALNVRVTFKRVDDQIEAYEVQADGSQVVTFDNRLVLLIEDGRYIEDMLSDADLMALVVNNYDAASRQVFEDALVASEERAKQERDNACCLAA